MDDLRGRYRVSYRSFDAPVGSNTAVLTQAYVGRSLQRSRRPRKDDDLSAARGAVNALLISLAFWIALGLVMFTMSWSG